MAEHASDLIQSQHEALSRIEDRLDQAARDAAARLRALQATAAEQTLRAEAAERQAAALEQQLAVAEARWAVEAMHAAGLAAQAAHLMALALGAGLPDLAEEAPLAGIYDAAFDAKAAELGIEDPARFRA